MHVSRKPTLSLIYYSFECWDTSVPLYSAKLTVHFIHNNQHHCRHFDLDELESHQQMNFVDGLLHSPSLFSPLQSDLTNSIQGEPPFCFTLKIHTGIHARIWLVDAWRHAACWLELDEDCILMWTDITLTLAFALLPHKHSLFLCIALANMLWFSAWLYFLADFHCTVSFPHQLHPSFSSSSPPLIIICFLPLSSQWEASFLGHWQVL